MEEHEKAPKELIQCNPAFNILQTGQFCVKYQLVQVVRKLFLH